MTTASAIGRTAREGARRRARASAAYRAEQKRLRPYEELARQIIRLRIDHDLSQEALAARVKTTKTAISRLESGRHAPTVETLRKIANAFNGHLLIGFDVPPAKGKRASPRKKLARV